MKANVSVLRQAPRTLFDILGYPDALVQYEATVAVHSGEIWHRREKPRLTWRSRGEEITFAIVVSGLIAGAAAAAAPHPLIRVPACHLFGAIRT